MAGLLAAHRLRQHGVDVEVLEASDRAGGMVRTVRRDGWMLDCGAVTTAQPTGEVANVLAGAGVGNLLQAPVAGATRRYLVHRGELIAVPDTTAEMVATPLLSVGGRLRMLREPFVARGDNGNETVTAFARRRFGDEAAARFIDPLVSGTSGGDPGQVLVGYTFPQLAEFERRAGSVLKGRMRASREARRTGVRPAAGGWSARGGLGSLPEALAAGLGASLRTGATVAGVEIHPSGATVLLGDGELRQYDALVVALPARAVAAIAWQGSGTGLDALADIPHSSLATVSLGYRRDAVAHPLDGHGLLAPSAEQRRVLSILFTSTLFPDRAPRDHVLLTAIVGGMRRPDDAALDDARLVEVVSTEVEALLGASGEAVLHHVQRWPQAMPLAVSGHGERLAAVDAVEAATRRVRFCGAWRDGLAVGDVMRGGVAAADRLLERPVA